MLLFKLHKNFSCIFFCLMNMSCPLVIMTTEIYTSWNKTSQHSGADPGILKRGGPTSEFYTPSPKSLKKWNFLWMPLTAATIRLVQIYMYYPQTIWLFIMELYICWVQVQYDFELVQFILIHSAIFLALAQVVLNWYKPVCFFQTSLFISYLSQTNN